MSPSAAPIGAAQNLLERGSETCAQEARVL